MDRPLHPDNHTSPGLQSEIQACNDQIAELMAKEELLNRYRQSLDATKRDIEGLAGKIDTIAGIWQYVRPVLPCLERTAWLTYLQLKTDMLLLKEQLALSVDPDMPITRVSYRPFYLSRHQR